MKPLYVLTGNVVHGKGNGRKVGMPTANLAVAEGTPLPAEGVYITDAVIDGDTWVGVTNIGRRPTVDDENRITIETYFPDLFADLYDKELTLCVYCFLRPTRPFSSLEEVKVQVERDAAAAREYFVSREETL